MSTRERREQSEKVRYAVVGLGNISQGAVLPAFSNTKNSKLTALVTSDAEKARTLSRKYGVKLTFDYEQYEDCLYSGEVDAVYIALPNGMHHEFTVRAARAGKHVLCEKPMAATTQECEDMIRVCQERRVKLMVAYRLHFEAGNLEAIRIAESGQLGELRMFNSTFSQQVAKGNIRLNGSAHARGGSLYDMGVYCINAARYLFQAEPVEVTAFSAAGQDERFRNVDEMTAGILRFPGERLASFICSFGAVDTSEYTLVGTKGVLRVDPAYDYHAAIRHSLKLGLSAPKTCEFPTRDQFGPELDYFSDCIRANKDPEPSGVEGLADVRIVEALYRSALSQHTVRLEPFEKKIYPTLDQEIKFPPVPQPKYINAAPPSVER